MPQYVFSNSVLGGKSEHMTSLLPIPTQQGTLQSTCDLVRDNTPQAWALELHIVGRPISLV